MINVDDRFLKEADEQELYLMLHIAKYMDKQNFAFPSVATLADATGWSERKIRRIKKRCIEKGFLKIVKRYKKDKGRDSDGYEILTDKISVYVNLKGKGIPPGQNVQGGGDKIDSTPLTKRTGEVLTNEVLNKGDSSESPYSHKWDDVYSFEQFWNDYGLKKRKRAAWKYWKRLPKKDIAAIKKFLPAYLSETEPKYRQYPRTFLSERTWDDYTERIQDAGKDNTAPTEYDGQYAKYLELVKKQYPVLASTVKYMSKAEFIDFLKQDYKMSDSIRKRVLRGCHDDISSGEVNHGTTVGELYFKRIKKKYREHQHV